MFVKIWQRNSIQIEVKGSVKHVSSGINSKENLLCLNYGSTIWSNVWKYFSIQSSLIAEETLLFGKLPVCSGLSVWQERRVGEKENGAFVVQYKQGKTEAFGEKNIPVPISLPQISPGLKLDRTPVYAGPVINLLSHRNTLKSEIDFNNMRKARSYLAEDTWRLCTKLLCLRELRRYIQSGPKKMYTHFDMKNITL